VKGQQSPHVNILSLLSVVTLECTCGRDIRSHGDTLTDRLITYILLKSTLLNVLGCGCCVICCMLLSWNSPLHADLAVLYSMCSCRGR